MIRFRDGFYADIRIEDRSRTVISYKAGMLEEMKNRVEKQAFLRVYDGRLWYYSSVTDVDHLQKTLDGLYSAATENANILEDPIVRRFEKNRAELMSFKDCSLRDIPLKTKQELLISYLPILSEEACVSVPEGTYLDRNSRFRFVSSLGADISYDYQTCGLSRFPQPRAGIHNLPRRIQAVRALVDNRRLQSQMPPLLYVGSSRKTRRSHT